MPLIQPYASAHASPKGPGDARPTAIHVVHDQNLVNALPGLNVLITGCTSGIGVETARALYQTGANIYITARNMAKGQEVAAELSTDSSRPVKVVEMSLDSFDSIREGAASFLAQGPKLHVLICNAGVMATPEGKTVDGFETQFGTNHLGHFLLFSLLKPALLAAGTPERPSRVIAVSSTGHRFCPALDFDNLNFEKTPYHSFQAYGNSKLSNIYFANHLTRLYQSHNLIGISLHPGSIETPLRRHVEEADPELIRKTVDDPKYMAQLKSTEQGAATTVWAAVGREWVHQGGVYLEDVGEAGPMEPEGSPWRPGYAPQAYKPDDEERLWEVSEKWCGL